MAGTAAVAAAARGAIEPRTSEDAISPSAASTALVAGATSRRRAHTVPAAGKVSDLFPWRAPLQHQGLPPAALAAELQRPLPPPSAKTSLPAHLQSSGHEPLWHVPPASRQKLEAAWGLLETPGVGVGRSRSDPLGYLDYMAWLQRAVPECDWVAPSDEEDESLKGLTAMERFRLAFPAKAPKGVAPLTEDERRLAEDALYGGGRPDEVLASRFSVDVTRGQMQCLLPRTWLNDEIINFYTKLLQERSNKATGPSCWFTNSFFWNKLSGGPSKRNDEYNYKEVRRWTGKAKVDIFALDLVIFPMNIGEMHWALGAIDIKNKGFRYFDSMTTRPHPNFVPFLRRYLQDEHKSKKTSPLEDADSWKLLNIEPPPPQQNNGYDCGVFTCFFADRISAGKPLDFEQDDMPDLRIRLTSRVVKADENWDDD